ncbi:hypothetical protein ACLOJK_025055 [Asimina triloba]
MAETSATPTGSEEKPWHSYTAEDLKRTVFESTDSALRSARSVQETSSLHFRAFQDGCLHSHPFMIWEKASDFNSGKNSGVWNVGSQKELHLPIWDFMQQAKSQYTTYEEAFFAKCKEELKSAQEHPVGVGVAVVAGLLLMGGPRRFLFRQTLGRLQSEELPKSPQCRCGSSSQVSEVCIVYAFKDVIPTKFLKAEKNVKELSISVDLMKNESKKLLQRAALAEDEMKKGHAKLKDAGNEIQRLAKSVYKLESEATGMLELFV